LHRDIKPNNRMYRSFVCFQRAVNLGFELIHRSFLQCS
jgi:hypothetical protein